VDILLAHTRPCAEQVQLSQAQWAVDRLTLSTVDSGATRVPLAQYKDL
jgi:hypothetical protein